MERRQKVYCVGNGQLARQAEARHESRNVMSEASCASEDLRQASGQGRPARASTAAWARNPAGSMVCAASCTLVSSGRQSGTSGGAEWGRIATIDQVVGHSRRQRRERPAGCQWPHPRRRLEAARDAGRGWLSGLRCTAGSETALGNGHLAIDAAPRVGRRGRRTGMPVGGVVLLAAVPRPTAAEGG